MTTKAKDSLQIHGSRGRVAFTVMEVLVAVSLAAVFLVGVYTALACTFDVMRATRENLRATQILEQKMEALRLFRWEQITNSTTLVTNFVDEFFPLTNAMAGGYSGGLTYTGAVAVTATPLTESYGNDMRLVTVRLQWKSGAKLCRREMQTFVSRYGLQNYYY